MPFMHKNQYHFFSLLKACCLVFPEQGFTARGKVALQQIMPEDSLVPQPSVCGRDSRIHLVTQVLTVFCTALDTPRRKSVSHDDIMPIWRIWEKSPIISDRGHADAFQIWSFEFCYDPWCVCMHVCTYVWQGELCAHVPCMCAPSSNLPGRKKDI